MYRLRFVCLLCSFIPLVLSSPKFCLLVFLMFLMIVSRHNPSLPLFATLPQVSARGLWRIVVGFSAIRECLLSTLELIIYMS